MSKATKKKRDAHFKKNADKPDGDKSSYKPAPGDKDAKTKPSKHTKKYHAMFPDKKDEELQEKLPYYRRLRNKLHQMIHPKGYDKLFKMYIKLRAKGETAREAIRYIGTVAKGVTARDFQEYIDSLKSDVAWSRLLVC